uniref:NADH dehydrogenase subunit 6 n=1 Tax=Elthusa poutassouiensis TaxID=3104314 RepID=UPI002E76CAD2|nr:NADH dehydrogenase subunit 6 [Elthusa poutassouiensis]WPS93553.1 NADH dehydrogenase subunit 6 [Elthusa poutassouiensis]
MFLWVTFIFSISSMILLSCSPHLLSLLLIITSISLSMLINTPTLWFSFILILVFTGGLMILILYTITLTSTNIFWFSPVLKPLTFFFILFTPFLMAIFLLFTSSPASLFSSPQLTTTDLWLSSPSSSYTYISTIIALLAALLIIITILKNKKAPLRLY